MSRFDCINNGLDNNSTSCCVEDENPQLFWPMFEFYRETLTAEDSPLFPGIQSVKISLGVVNKYKESASFFSFKESVFWYELLMGCREAFIIDKFFSVETFKRLLDCWDKAKPKRLRRLYIFCEREIKELCVIRKEKRLLIEKNLRAEIEIYNASGVDIHDRFALLDNKLWHFGSSVCGVESHLTAFSGGWPDIDRMFRSFLESIIKGQTQ